MSWSLNASAASTQEVSCSLASAIRRARSSEPRSSARPNASSSAATQRRIVSRSAASSGYGAGHELDRSLGERAEPGGLEAEHATLLDRAAHDPPQGVAALLVGGHHAVGDQERHPLRVVRDDPHRARRLRIVAVGAPGLLLGELDQRPIRVGLEHRADPLEDRRHPLQAHAGVDVVLGQRGQRAVLVKLVAHEDVVPVLEEAIGVVPRPIVGTAELGAAVEVHLRARAARADEPRLPEVLRSGQLHDALLGDAALGPDPDRLGVGSRGRAPRPRRRP